MASPQRDEMELTTKEAKSLLDDIASLGSPKPVVVLTGGDPCKREDLLELISYSRSLGLATGVAPSGTPLLSSEMVTNIRHAGATSMSLSLDGADPDTHDSFRGEPGSFELTLDAAITAISAGMRLQLNSSVCKTTVMELPKLAKLALELGVITWSLFLLVPTGRGIDLEALSADEIEDLFHFCVDISQIIPVKVTEAPHYRRVLAMRAALSESGEDWIKRLNPGLLYYELRNQFDNLGIGPKINQTTDRATTKRPPLAINAGNGFAFVSHRGDVCPSGFLPISAGNIRFEPLSVIYKTSELFKNLRDSSTLNGKCGRCEFNGVCGGSRSRAFGVNNDTNSDDPSCNYVPGTFQI